MNTVQKPDLVRQEYKKYKRRKPPPDFSDVIDIRAPKLTGKSTDRIEKITFTSKKDWSVEACKVGLRNPEEWNVFLVKSSPGFMIISSPFFPDAQKYWCYKALTEYAMKPYPCNLDIHIEEGERENLWKATNKSSSSSSGALIDKLRWAHLGYHFDYNFVNYKEEKYYGFPDDLASLMKVVAIIIGYEHYVPETAIVNYYPIGSSMGGHTDHYEEDLDAPLLSISFGQPCVFLIGGATKDVQPEAVWVRSGDLIVMANESRVAYHAVPCIVKESDGDEPPEPLKISEGSVDTATDDTANSMNHQVATTRFCEKSMCYCGCENNKDHLWSTLNMNKTEWEPFAKYLSRTRININVRQVHRR